MRRGTQKVKTKGQFSRSLCLPLPSRTLLRDSRPRGQHTRQFPCWEGFRWDNDRFSGSDAYFLNTCFSRFGGFSLIVTYLPKHRLNEFWINFRWEKRVSSSSCFKILHFLFKPRNLGQFVYSSSNTEETRTLLQGLGIFCVVWVILKKLLNSSHCTKWFYNQFHQAASGALLEKGANGKDCMGIEEAGGQWKTFFVFCFS